MVLIAAQSADFPNRDVGKAEEVFCLLNAQRCDKLAGRHTGFFQKMAMETGMTQARNSNQPVNGNIFKKVLPNMPDSLPYRNCFSGNVLAVGFSKKLRKQEQKA